MSGIEVVGLVLAVLPVAVSAAKACSVGSEESKKLFGNKGHNEIRRDLFGEIYRELFLFHRHLKNVLQKLPTISEQRCNQILNNLDERDWQSKSDVAQALESYLAEDFDHFEHAIKQVFSWFDRILGNRSLHSQPAPKNITEYLKNIKVLTEASNLEKIENRFHTRLQLWWKEDRLKGKIRNLKEWRKFLEKIPGKTQRRIGTDRPLEVRKKTARPSSAIPQLSTGLYQVLSDSLRCVPSCSGTHGAKICLQTETDLHRKADGDSLNFKLLLLKPSSGPSQGSEKWLEAAIKVNKLSRRSKVSFNSTRIPPTKVQSVCSTLSTHRPQQGAKLCFSVECIEQESNSVEIYSARNYHKSHFEFQPTATEIKLSDLLNDLGQHLNLPERRRLALELSYGMMTLSGSPWMEDRWSKQHVSFFHTHASKICHTQPLVSSDMKQHCASKYQQLPLDVMHPLPPVLSLGIILLELETGESVESMRADEDFVDPVSRVPNENTDFTAAFREAEKRDMLSPLYKEAVLACLNEQEWADGPDTEPSLLQERVREKMYEKVIQNLESDLEAMLNPNM